jgi:hypothetical protein
MTGLMEEQGTNPGPPIKGVITARTCEHCGHHEIGIITDEGQFVSLRPGMVVEIKGEAYPPRSGD